MSACPHSGRISSRERSRASDRRSTQPMRLRMSSTRFVPRVAVVLGALALAGCAAVGPDYSRPQTTLPASYGQPSAAPIADAAAEPGGLDWWKRFGDPQLDTVVETALANNTDLQVAVARVEEADAVMREVGAAFLPAVSLGGTAARSQLSGDIPGGTGLLWNNLLLSLSASYEIDFWGRVRRSSEAARAQALASRYARDVVQLSIAGLTAQTWFALRSLDEQIALTRRTLDARERGVGIVALRLEAGTASRLDLEQARGSRADAAIQLRDLQRQRSLAQTLLGRLTGQPDLSVPSSADDQALTTMPVPPQPPPGLPSDLLARRPDLRQAEEQLVAANAQIGVARAAMLPTISLTGALGGQSTALAGLIDSGARIWSLGFGLSLPIFDGGRLQARSDQALARERQALAAYQGAAQSAFREVSDALIAAQAAREVEADVVARSEATARSLELSRLRYLAGYSGALEVLDAQRSTNTAELEVVRNRQTRLNAAVDLFKALSGSWTDAQALGGGAAPESGTTPAPGAPTTGTATSR